MSIIRINIYKGFENQRFSKPKKSLISAGFGI